MPPVAVGRMSMHVFLGGVFAQRGRGEHWVEGRGALGSPFSMLPPYYALEPAPT